MLELFAAVNRDASRTNRTVSEACFVSFTNSTGAGGGMAFDIPEDEEYKPKFALPPGISLQPKLNPDGTSQPIMLVQMGMQRSGNTGAFHRRQIAANPNAASTWNNYGVFLLNVQHDEKAAAEAFSKAIAVDANERNALGNLANIFKHRGELDEAEDLYRRALEVDPMNTVVRRDFAEFLAISRNDPIAAVKIYEDGLELNPGDTLLSEGLSKVPTRESYLKAIEDEPQSSAAYNNYGVYMECVEGDLVTAGEAYRQALELDPNSVNAIGNLGICLLRSGEIDAAEEALRRAVELDPGDIRRRNNLGEFLRDERQDFEKARTVYEEGLVMAPSSRTLREGLESLPAIEGFP
jgi:Tfp pilus assembly protein PilF